MEQEWGLQAKRMEDINGHGAAAHRHDGYTIIWVEEGQGKHYIDFEAYEVRGRQVFLLAPEQMHRLEMRGPHRGSVLQFTPDFLMFTGLSEAFLIEEGLFPDFGHEPLTTSQAFEAAAPHLVQLIFYETSRPASRGKALCGALLKAFLLLLLRLRGQQGGDGPPSPGNRAQAIVCDFRNLLNSEHLYKHKVSEYAEALHLSPDYLNEVLRAATGKTAKALIQQRLIAEAQRQALHTDCTLQEITYHLGFKAPAHFSKFFKKHTGMTFLAYRSHLRQLYGMR